MKITPFVRIVNLTIAFIFLVTSTTYGVPRGLWETRDGKSDSASQPGELLSFYLDPAKLVIPENFGSITERFTSSGTENSKKLIIQIQDSHCNYEAQTNIRKIVETMSADKEIAQSLKLVATEGAKGLVDPSFLRSFPDPKIRQEASDYFVKIGWLTGTEMYAVNFKDKPLPLWGIEDKALYDENLEAFRKTKTGMLKEKEFVDKLSKAVDLLKLKVFSKDMLAFVKMREGWDKNAVQFTEYCSYIDKLAAGKIPLINYPNFTMVIGSMEIEKKIDPKKIDGERQAMINELQKKMVKEELSELVKQSLFLRTGKITSDMFYAYLKDASSVKKLDLSKYPNLAGYMEIVFKNSKVNAGDLFDEVDRIEKAVKAKMYVNSAEKELDQTIDQVKVLKNLLDLRMTRRDLTYYEENKNELTPAALVQRISVIARSSGGEAISIKTDTLDFSPCTNFYDFALKRDKVLVENTITEMEKRKATAVAFVTGGFHTQGAKELFKAKGYSYVVVTPRMMQTYDDKIYLSRMLNEQSEFDKLFANTGNRLAAWSLLDTYKLKEAFFAYALAKLSKDEDRIKGKRQAWIDAYKNFHNSSPEDLALLQKMDVNVLDGKEGVFALTLGGKETGNPFKLAEQGGVVSSAAVTVTSAAPLAAHRVPKYDWVNFGGLTTRHFENGVLDRSAYGKTYEKCDEILSRLWNVANINAPMPEFVLLDRDDPNASYNSEQNRIFLHKGFFDFFKNNVMDATRGPVGVVTEEDIAFVLAHELAHHLQRLQGFTFDSVEKMQAAERDADANALRMMNRAGYPTRNAPQFFVCMKKYKRNEGKRILDDKRAEIEMRKEMIHKLEKGLYDEIANNDIYMSLMPSIPLPDNPNKRIDYSLFENSYLSRLIEEKCVYLREELEKVVQNRIDTYPYRNLAHVAFKPEWVPKSARNKIISQDHGRYYKVCEYHGEITEDEIAELKNNVAADNEMSDLDKRKTMMAIDDCIFSLKEGGCEVPYFSTHPVDDDRIANMKTFISGQFLKSYHDRETLLSGDVLNEVARQGSKQRDAAILNNYDILKAREHIKNMGEFQEVLFFVARMNIGHRRKLLGFITDILAARSDVNAFQKDIYRYQLLLLCKHGEECRELKAKIIGSYDLVTIVKNMPILPTGGIGDNVDRVQIRTSHFWHFTNDFHHEMEELILDALKQNIALKKVDTATIFEILYERYKRCGKERMEFWSDKLFEVVLEHLRNVEVLPEETIRKLLRYAETRSRSDALEAIFHQQLRANKDLIRIMKDEEISSKFVNERILQDFWKEGVVFPALGDNYQDVLRNLYYLLSRSSFSADEINLVYKKYRPKGDAGRYDYEFISFFSDFMNEERKGRNEMNDEDYAYYFFNAVYCAFSENGAGSYQEVPLDYLSQFGMGDHIQIDKEAIISKKTFRYDGTFLRKDYSKDLENPPIRMRHAGFSMFFEGDIDGYLLSKSLQDNRKANAIMLEILGEEKEKLSHVQQKEFVQAFNQILGRRDFPNLVVDERIKSLLPYDMQQLLDLYLGDNNAITERQLWSLNRSLLLAIYPEATLKCRQGSIETVWTREINKLYEYRFVESKKENTFITCLRQDLRSRYAKEAAEIETLSAPALAILFLLSRGYRISVEALTKRYAHRLDIAEVERLYALLQDIVPGEIMKAPGDADDKDKRAKDFNAYLLNMFVYILCRRAVGEQNKNDWEQERERIAMPFFGEIEGKRNSGYTIAGLNSKEVVSPILRTIKKEKGRKGGKAIEFERRMDAVNFGNIEQLIEGYSGKDFKKLGWADMVSHVAQSVPPSVFRNYFMVYLFQKYILRRQGDNLFIPQVMEGLRQRGAELRAPYDVMARSMIKDAGIESFNDNNIKAYLYKNREFNILEEKEAAYYAGNHQAFEDGEFNELGTRAAYVDLYLGSVFDGYLTSMIDDHTVPAVKKVQEVEAVYPRASNTRDRMLMKIVSTSSLQDLPGEELTRIAELLNSDEKRDRVNLLRLTKSIDESPETTFEEELSIVGKYFPERSAFRDDILDQVEADRAATREDVDGIRKLRSSDHAVRLEEDVAKADAKRDNIRVALNSLVTRERQQVLFWLIGLEDEKPAPIKKLEILYHVKLDYLRDRSAYDTAHYKNIGKTERKRFLDEILLKGETSIIRSGKVRECVDELWTRIMGRFHLDASSAQNTATRKILLAVFAQLQDDPDRQCNILSEVMFEFNRLEKDPQFAAEGDEQKEAMMARVFLAALGIIGIKIAQYMSVSNNFNMGDVMKAELGKLKEGAQGIDKFALMSVLSELGYTNIRIEKKLGAASIKTVFSIEARDVQGNEFVVDVDGASIKGHDVVFKIKNLQVFYDAQKDLARAGDIIERLQNEGVLTVAQGSGLVGELKRIIGEEEDFDLEQRNARHLSENNAKRRAAGPTGTSGYVMLYKVLQRYFGDLSNYTIGFPKIYAVKSNMLIIEERIRGVSLDKYTGADKDKIFQAVMLELLRQVFEDGVYHADLHPGNIIIKDIGNGKKEIVFIDLGGVNEIGEAEKEALRGMFMSLVVEKIRTSYPYIPVDRVAQMMGIGEVDTFKNKLSFATQKSIDKVSYLLKGIPGMKTKSGAANAVIMGVMGYYLGAHKPAGGEDLTMPAGDFKELWNGATLSDDQKAVMESVAQSLGIPVEKVLEKVRIAPEPLGAGGVWCNDESSPLYQHILIDPESAKNPVYLAANLRHEMKEAFLSLTHIEASEWLNVQEDIERYTRDALNGDTDALARLEQLAKPKGDVEKTRDKYKGEILKGGRDLEAAMKKVETNAKLAMEAAQTALKTLELADKFKILQSKLHSLPKAELESSPTARSAADIILKAINSGKIDVVETTLFDLTKAFPFDAGKDMGKILDELLTGDLLPMLQLMNDKIVDQVVKYESDKEAVFKAAGIEYTPALKNIFDAWQFYALEMKKQGKQIVLDASAWEGMTETEIAVMMLVMNQAAAIGMEVLITVGEEDKNRDAIEKSSGKAPLLKGKMLIGKRGSEDFRDRIKNHIEGWKQIELISAKERISEYDGIIAMENVVAVLVSNGRELTKVDYEELKKIPSLQKVAEQIQNGDLKLLEIIDIKTKSIDEKQEAFKTLGFQA